MNKEKNELVKHFIYFVVCGVFLVFSLVFTITYGWFLAQRNVGANSAKLKIQSRTDVTTASCYALKYDGIAGAACYLIESDSEYSIEMSEFDTVFTDMNVNTPFIIRAYVSELDESVKTNTNGYFQLSVSCFGSYANSDNSIINNLSNVLCVKAGCGLNAAHSLDTFGEEIDDNEKVALYNGAVAGFRSDGVLAKTFVKGTVSAREKDTELVVTIPYSSYKDHIQTDKNGHLYCVIYLELDYNSELIMEYKDKDLSSTGIKTNLECDIGSIYIDWKDGANE